MSTIRWNPAKHSTYLPRSIEPASGNGAMWLRARPAVLRCLVCLIWLSLYRMAAAQNDVANALLSAHRGAIVQLQVRGKINNKPAFENGTGFLFQTAAGPRIITAGHVIGPDDKWDSLVDRCIYYRLAQNGGSLLYDCV